MKRKVLTLSILALLSGCNSSSSSDSAQAPKAVVGTAATGAALFGQIDIINGSQQKNLLSDKQGKFQLGLLDDVELPAVVKAQGSAGGGSYTLYSLITEEQKQAGIVNATPFTQLVLSRITGVHAETVFANPAVYQAQFTDSNIDSAQAELKSVLDNLLNAAGINTHDLDFFNTPFDADYTGIDAVMDMIDVQFDTAQAVLTYKADQSFQETLIYSTNWDNQELVDGSKTPAEIKAALDIVTVADNILEQMVLAQDETSYKDYLHADAYWYGASYEGIFDEKEKVIPSEQTKMDRFSDFNVIDVQSDRFLLGYTEVYENSNFASGGRAKAWFKKETNEYKFLGQENSLPTNIALELKYKLIENHTENTETESWALGINGFPSINVCENITLSTDNTGWFAAKPELKMLADVTLKSGSAFPYAKAIISGPGIQDVTIDSIYKEVNNGKITGCHLASSELKNSWGYPLSIVIDGVTVTSPELMLDNSEYTVTYYDSADQVVSSETLSISKGYDANTKSLLPTLKEARLDANDFYYSWSPAKMTTSLDVWAYNNSSTRLAVPKGQTFVESKTMTKRLGFDHALVDNFGRSLTIAHSNFN